MTATAQPQDATQVAAWLMDQHATRQRFSSVRPLGVQTLAQAYDVQRHYVRLQQAQRGVGIAGWKIGLTSPPMQKLCGIDHPIAGAILADRVHASGVRLSRTDYGRFGVEFEIAVRLAHELDGARFGPDGEPTLADVRAAIDAVAPAMEIVDDRGCDYPSLDVQSLVADNSWNSGVVLGEFVRRWPELDTVQGVLHVTGGGASAAGEPRHGRGSDVLGHPLRPVAWLVRHLAASGDRLRPGDVVMTGSMIVTQFPTVAQEFTFEVGGLGAVRMTLRD